MSIYDFAQDVRGDARRQRLLVDEDFSWSDAPSKRRSTPADEQRPHSREASATTPRRRASTSIPEPAPAHVDQSVYEDESAYDDGFDPDLEVRDLRAPRDRYPDRDVRPEDIIGEAELEPVEPDALYADERTGGVAVTSEGRRTIVITGHGAERHLPARPRREASLRMYERDGFKPDRIALWAFLLALALILGATTTSHAATLVHHLPH